MVARVERAHEAIGLISRDTARTSAEVANMHAWVKSWGLILRLCIPALIPSLIAYAPSIWAAIKGLF